MRGVAQLSHIQGVLRQRDVNRGSALLCLWVPQPQTPASFPPGRATELVAESLHPMALTGHSCPSPSSLSPCPRCAILALSTSGINPCSPSPAPNQSLLLLDAHCFSPGVAWCSHCLSRCLPGLLRCCHRLPPELFRAGPVPSPTPAWRLCYSCEIQSLVPLRDAGAPSPPSHGSTGPPAAGGPAWGLSHLAKQFTGAAQVA